MCPARLLNSANCPTLRASILLCCRALVDNGRASSLESRKQQNLSVNQVQSSQILSLSRFGQLPGNSSLAQVQLGIFKAAKLRPYSSDEVPIVYITFPSLANPTLYRPSIISCLSLVLQLLLLLCLKLGINLSTPVM